MLSEFNQIRETITFQVLNCFRIRKRKVVTVVVVSVIFINFDPPHSVDVKEELVNERMISKLPEFITQHSARVRKHKIETSTKNVCHKI